MQDLQSAYDDAMFAFSQGDYPAAEAKLQAILEKAPDDFDARLALGMVYYRQNDFALAISEGHKAEKLRPREQLVHTNLSLFYMKSGDKKMAEHHGLQARIASWKAETKGPVDPGSQPALPMAGAKPAASAPVLPEMPWKKKPADSGGKTPASD